MEDELLARRQTDVSVAPPAFPIVYLNSRLLPFSEASLSLHDAGFVYGATVTERFRTFSGNLFRIDSHLKRFRQGCELARIPQPKRDDELLQIITEVLKSNRSSETELAVLMFATPGPVGALAGSEGDGPPTLGVYAFPLNLKRYRHLFETGAELNLSPATISPALIDPLVKHRSRLHWWIAERANPFLGRNLLFYDASGGHVRETSAANFLSVSQGEVVSPPLNKVLNGIALGVVEELCRDLGIAFGTRERTLEEVMTRSDECFLTNSSFGVAPVSRIEERTLPYPGPIFKCLLQAYSDRVGVDLRGQILASRTVDGP